MRLPLYYESSFVAYAHFDDRFEQLSLYNLGVRVQTKVLNLAKGRPDVIVGLLREDPIYQRRLRPFFHIANRQVLAHHVVLRQGIFDLLVEAFMGTITPKNAFKRIQDERQSIGYVVFVDGNRLNLKESNLREVTKG
jgi:hypothetical protein